MKVNRMTVVGCGGIGVHFIRPAVSLLGSGIQIRLVDGDKYENKNLMRQLIPFSAVGVNKAEWMSKQFSADITAYQEYVHSDEQFAGFHANGNKACLDKHGQDSVHVVAICVDNDATRRMIYDGIRMTGVPTFVIDMANEEENGDVIVWAWDGKADIFPFPPKMYPNIAEPKDRPPNGYCAVNIQKGSTQIIPTNMMAACLGVRILYDLLNDKTITSQVMFDWSKQGIVWRM